MKEMLFILFPLLSLSRKLLLFVILVDFVQYDFQMVIVVLLEHMFVKANCIVQKKRQRKLLNSIRKQTSGDDGFSTFTLDWQIQYLPFLTCSNQEYRCWFSSPFLHLQKYLFFHHNCHLEL